MARIDLIVGARPNFMKAAPVLEQLRAYPSEWDVRLIHTGQHYDEKLSDVFFRQLGMPQPDVNLGIGSGTHAEQTARIMIALDSLFVERRPDLVMVFGDVNSTLAGALVASKMQIPVAHVEAGLRSFDRTMPEEINRVLTDTVSDWLFTTESSAELHLRQEGITLEKIHFVGNTMIDTLLKHKAHAISLEMPSRLRVTPGRYAVVTLHRPSNVDNPALLRQILTALLEIAVVVPVIFPVHPRTAQQLPALDFGDSLVAQSNLRMLEPLSYLEFVGLLAQAGVVLTDSGGIQEETTILGVPCLTLRENTERPITLTEGTNRLIGVASAQAIVDAALNILQSKPQNNGRQPALWDGHAAERIIAILRQGVRP